MDTTLGIQIHLKLDGQNFLSEVLGAISHRLLILYCLYDYIIDVYTMYIHLFVFLNCIT